MPSPRAPHNLNDLGGDRLLVLLHLVRLDPADKSRLTKTKNNAKKA
jgi:hypothetical protein